MRATITIEIDKAVGRRLLAPIGIATPHEMPLAFRVDGAEFAFSGEDRRRRIARRDRLAVQVRTQG